MYSNGLHIIFKHSACDFAYLTGLDVQLLQKNVIPGANLSKLWTSYSTESGIIFPCI